MIKLSEQAIKDIRFDAEQNCVGASVGDTLLLLSELKRAKAELQLAQIEWQKWRERAEALMPEAVALMGRWQDMFDGGFKDGALSHLWADNASFLRRYSRSVGVTGNPREPDRQDEEMPGMWDKSDIAGGETDCPRPTLNVTPDEAAVHLQLGHVWNAYCALPVEHSQDQPEFCHHIHSLQRLVSCRSGRRQMLAKERVKS